jgi:hypothetical protein
LAKALRYAADDDPLTAYLPRLITDPDPKTRRRALLAAASLNRKEFLPAIISYLGDPKLRGLAQDALVAYGPSILDDLRGYMDDPNEPLPVRLRLPGVISRIGTQKSVEILHEHLHSRIVLLRYSSLRGLNRIRNRQRDLQIPRKGIRDLITVEARGYIEIHSYAEAIAAGKSGSRAEKLLMQALGDRQKLHLEQAFRLAGLIYPIDDMYNAYNSVTSSVRTMRARAIEFLDTVWGKEEKKHLFPILERNVRLDEAGRQLFKLPSMTRKTVLHRLLTGEDAWLAACAAFVISEERLSEYRSDLEPLVQSDHDALRETAQTALNTLAAG